MRSLADNKKLLGLLQTIKLYCRLRPMGCKDELHYDQFEEHEQECGRCVECARYGIIKENMHSHFIDDCDKYAFECQFCGVEENKNNLVKKHRCYQMHLGNTRDGRAYYFVQNRIANFGSIKNIFQQLKCDQC
jgi:hypothetical protein